MAMDKSGMAQALIDGMKDVDDPSKAMKAFADAMKGYIEDNCEIQYSWTATLPPPPANTGLPDPTTSFVSSIKYPAFPLASPPAFEAFGPMITAAIITGIITHPTDPPPFAIPPGVLLPIPIILTQSKADNQKDAMEHLANEVINGMKKMINPAPLPGVHGTYVIPTPGAIMTKIS